MANPKIRIPVETLKSFMKDVFIKLGVPESDAETCSSVLIASDLRGIESHGVGRLKMYFDRIRNGQQKAVTNFEIVKEGPTTAVVDGNHGMGMVIGTKAMQLAIDKAKEFGMGSVAVRNSTHFGIDGYYARMAIEAGMIGMSFTNARPSIAPTFSVQPMLGTNPIAFGAPTDEELPYLFDGATSITQRGKVEVLDREEKPVPPGWVIDQQCKDMTDAPEILNALPEKKAALLPLGGVSELSGGHKGYGLATIVEILSASLQQGNFLNALIGFNEKGEKQPFCLGHFFMAINIEAFTELDNFKKTTGEILRELRAAQKAPGQERIYTANEKEYENEIRIAREGVPVNENLQKNIQFIQKELGMDNYKFPF